MSEERVLASLRRNVYERAQKRCEGCRKTISIQQMNAHHILPFVQSGVTSLNNLACLCKPCHRIVHDRWPIWNGQWHRVQAGKIPIHHQQYIKLVFSWKEFPEEGVEGCEVSVPESGWGTEYHWDGEEFWRYRIYRNKRLRSIKEGRRLLKLLLKRHGTEVRL